MKLTFPTVISVLNPLKKQLTWISLMNFNKINLILKSYVNKLSVPEMIVLLNFLIEMNAKTRKLKRIIITILLILSCLGIYQLIKWSVWIFKFFRRRTNWRIN